MCVCEHAIHRALCGFVEGRDYVRCSLDSKYVACQIHQVKSSNSINTQEVHSTRVQCVWQRPAFGRGMCQLHKVESSIPFRTQAHSTSMQCVWQSLCPPQSRVKHFFSHTRSTQHKRAVRLAEPVSAPRSRVKQFLHILEVHKHGI